MEDSYSELLLRTATESQRLDQQFDIITQNIGYLLHPSIRSKLSSSPSIADVGTGTGRFPLQLAKEYPEATLRGFDMSSAQFPDPKTLPPNVTLGVWDVKQPPPDEEHGRYDVVHVRFVGAGMDSRDWETAVGHLFGLLKPGGVLQWAEGDVANGAFYRGETDSRVATIQAVGKRFRDALQKRVSYGIESLPQIMKDTRFVHTEEDVVSSDRIAETRSALTRIGMVAAFGWARMMTAHGAPGSFEMDELKRLEDRVSEEIESGAYSRYDIHIVIALKVA
ncbi:hypothetical protein ACLMJK_009542 [Lecanora helva]